MSILRARLAIPALFITLLLVFSPCVHAENDHEQQILSDATKELQLSGTDIDFREKAEAFVNGESIFDAGDMFSWLTDLLFGFFKDNLPLLAKLAALCVFSGVITAITGEDSSQVSFLACLSIVASLSVDVLRNVLQLAESTIDNLLIFMQSLIPSVVMLSAGSDAAFAVSFHPSLFACIHVVIYACRECFLPMLMFTAVLSVINSMTARFHVTKLLETCSLFIKWGLGILMTVYIALLSVHGFSSAMQAGALSKTVKYAVSSFIPVVGGVLAESAESVLASMSLIKNAVGITGVLAVFSSAAPPLLNILATSVVFRLCASITEPASDKRIVKLVSGFASAVSLAFSILLAVSAMFVISIAMLLSLTNLPQMMR